MDGAQQVGDPIAILPVLCHLLWSQGLTVDLSRPLHETAPRWLSGRRGERVGVRAAGRGLGPCRRRGPPGCRAVVAHRSGCYRHLAPPRWCWPRSCSAPSTSPWSRPPRHRGGLSRSACSSATPDRGRPWSRRKMSTLLSQTVSTCTSSTGSSSLIGRWKRPLTSAAAPGCPPEPSARSPRTSFGFDVSHPMLLAAEALPGVSYARAAAEQLPLQSQSCDLVAARA